MTESRDDRLEALLSESGLSIFPPEIQAEVESLLDKGQSLEPDTRSRLVNAAQRGSKRVADRRAAIEVVLFTERRAIGRDIDALAADIGLDSHSMLSIERGDHSVDSQPAAVVAAWARSLGLDRDTVRVALQRSFSARDSVPAYAGAAEPPLSPEHEQYIEDVIAALAPPGPEGSS
jgi:hypothetical protein